MSMLCGFLIESETCTKKMSILCLFKKIFSQHNVSFVASLDSDVSFNLGWIVRGVPYLFNRTCIVTRKGQEDLIVQG